MLRLIMATLVISSLALSPAGAKPCRDAKGKFIKCPPAAAAKASTKCRDAKGHFAKCGTPGAKPA